MTAAATSWKAKLPDVPATGLWRLEVRGANGTSGAFTVLVTGKDTVKASGTAAAPVSGTQDIPFVAGDGVALTVTLKRLKGSHAVPQLVVLDPTGLPLEGGRTFIGSTKSGALMVKGYRLPFFGKYTLKLSAADGAAGGVSYTVSTAPAKIKGKVPTANPGVSGEAEPDYVGHLDGSASTAASGGALTYRWAQVAGPSCVVTGGTTATPTFVTPAAESSVAFQLSVAENGLMSRAVTVGIEVAKRPVADAGRSQSVAPSAAVTLDGAGSLDRRGSGLTFAWRQMPGDAASVTLSGSTTASPSFTAPSSAQTLHFGLTVDDGLARSFEDVVVVDVGPARAVADAGREQYVPRMAAVHLSGLASRTASGLLDAPILWTQISGPPVTLAGATSPWPSFTAPKTAGDFVFELSVGGMRDGAAGVADRTVVHVRTTETNRPAPARTLATPAMSAGGSVSLTSGGTFDPESDPVTYRWTQIAGAPAALATPLAATSTAAIPAGSDQYVFALQANDGLQYGAPDAATVRNTAFSARPVAAAGANRYADPGILVTLDGSGSVRTDGSGVPLSYQWTQVSGLEWFDVAAKVPAFNSRSVQPSFALPIDVSSLLPTETVLFELVVDDGTHASLPDIVSVTFTNVPLNGKPSVTAAASDTNPIVGEVVALLGTVSDGDGDNLTVKWKQTAGPAVVLSPSATTLSPTFVAPAQGTMTFQITGQDGFWDSAPATVDITVDRKPTAASIAVSPASFGPAGTLVTMSSAASSDPEGAPLIYKWTQVGPQTVTLAPSGSSVQFTSGQGAVTVQLIVNDGRQDSGAQTATFTSTLPPPAPTSNATNGKAPYGGSVTLNANPGAGGPYSFTWRQINSGSDPNVTLSSTTAQNPTFTVPLPTSAPFGQAPSATFGVTESNGQISSAEVTVTVNFYASFNATSLTSSTNTVYTGIIAGAGSCTSCHSGSNNTCPIYSGYEYGMGSASAFLTNTVGVASCGSTKSRTPSSGTTGQSSNSFLLDRIKNIGGSGPMPPFGSLTNTQKNLIQDWIDQGSQNN